MLGRDREGERERERGRQVEVDDNLVPSVGWRYIAPVLGSVRVFPQKFDLLKSLLVCFICVLPILGLLILLSDGRQHSSSSLQTFCCHLFGLEEVFGIENY